MTEPIRFTVLGTPQPQGSKSAFINPKTGRPIIAEDNSAPKKAWRSAVAEAARTAFLFDGRGPLNEPVEVRVTFRFAATKSKPHRHHHCVTPDSDKLARSLGDALKVSGMIRDDSLVSDWVIRKRWCLPGEPEGATVAVVPLGEVEAEAEDTRRVCAGVAPRRART